MKCETIVLSKIIKPTHTISEKSFNSETSKKYNINEKETTKLNSFTKHSESFPQQPPLYGYVFDLLIHYKVAKENWYKTTKTNKKMVDIQIFIAIKTKNYEYDASSSGI